MSKFKPGFRPIDYKVVIYPDQVDEKTKGGILLPEATRTKEQDAEMWATFVSASPVAFNYDDFPEDMRPKPGDRVSVSRYAGRVEVGKDGKEYRIVNDKDISLVGT